jgi:transcriptional regulator
VSRIDSGSLYGTLNLLILTILSEQSLHGLGIARRIESRTGEALQIEEGALYPALHRLEAEGLLASKWGISEKGRRAKLYALTDRGRTELGREMDRWRRHTDAVQRVLIKASPATT